MKKKIKMFIFSVIQYIFLDRDIYFDYWTYKSRSDLDSKK